MRAVPIVVDDIGIPFVIRTTAPTVGEALRQAEITIYLGDRVVPSLGSEVSPGLRVVIQRSVPVTLDTDGLTYKTRTRGDTVADALSAMQIGVSGMDRVEPSLETELYDNIRIDVTRVSEDVEVDEQIAPYETVFVADGNLAIDTQQVVDNGAEGVTRTRYRVRFEDGQEVTRVLGGYLGGAGAIRTNNCLWAANYAADDYDCRWETNYILASYSNVCVQL